MMSNDGKQRNCGGKRPMVNSYYWLVFSKETKLIQYLTGRREIVLYPTFSPAAVALDCVADSAATSIVSG
jgi:hypothetical protein